MIRKPQKEDFDQLLKLFQEFENFNLENLISPELKIFHEYKNMQETHEFYARKYVNGDGFIVFVAEEEGVLVGFACARIEDDKEAVLDKIAHVEDWFVTENYRDKGIGDELFKALETKVKNLGCNQIKLEVFTKNQKALEIYRKFGFLENTLEMVKKL